jgi:para-aminobenzoate synthetase component 1
VKRRIGAGEIFQANIARGWSGVLKPGTAPFDAFARLVADSPAPYCAYWRLPRLALVSHSPERFLTVAGDRVETSPIKGTRPRSVDPAEDRLLADELLASEKDRAENLMIVDLMRNDLSRVCRPGSVKTPRLFTLQSHPSVHHLVSTVTGRLRADVDAADLLAAAFPPGSITGAPKIQAMKVIAAHEPPRGPWCGALFWAGVDGAFESSVLIRTAAFVETDGGGWRFRVTAGAGIVADSDPPSERLETEVKASGLARALTGAPR